MRVAVPGVTKVSRCFSQKHLGFFSLQLGFSTAAGQRHHLLLQLFLSSQIVTGALQPQPSHMKGSVYLVVALFWMLPGMLEAAGPAGRAAGSQHGECSPCTNPRCSPGKFTVRWHQQFPSKLCWDFTLEAACKFNKYCNILVRQLY